MSENSSVNFHVLGTIDCLFSEPSSIVFLAYNITKVLLLLPPCSLILLLGLQQCRAQRSTSAAATSHSDSFTHHLVAMELIGLSGCVLSCCGIIVTDGVVLLAGVSLWSFTWFGEIYFHLVTCVERYLAVVHPVTYRGLRGERGTWIRNITIGCVWLLCFGGTAVRFQGLNLIIDLSLMTLSFVVISFCNVSVLCVLIRPGPGDQGGDRPRVDQSKLRAFHTLVAICGVLFLKVASSLVSSVLSASKSSECELMTCEVWFNLPSNLVLPLLFLHRAGKFAFCARIQPSRR